MSGYMITIIIGVLGSTDVVQVYNLSLIFKQFVLDFSRKKSSVVLIMRLKHMIENTKENHVNTDMMANRLAKY